MRQAGIVAPACRDQVGRCARRHVLLEGLAAQQSTVAPDAP